MTIRSTVPRLIAAAAFAGSLLAAPLIVGATANGASCPAGQWQDWITGICWSQNSPASSFSSSPNSPCLPGRLGLCMSAYQNTPVPGATLSGSAPSGSWP